MNQHNELPPTRKNPGITYFACYCKFATQINVTMAPVQITHKLATVHHPQNYPKQPLSNQ